MSGVKTVKSKAGKVKKVVSNPFSYEQKEKEKERAIEAAQIEISAASKSGEKLSNQRKQDIANKAMKNERELIQEENKELENLKNKLKERKTNKKKKALKITKRMGNVDAARELIKTRLTKETINKKVEDTREEMLRKRREEMEKQKNMLSLGEESGA